MNKQAYRIEVLTSEKETLEKRIDAFEQEIAWTWQEQEKNIEKITCLSWVELVQNEGALSVTTTGSAKQDTRMRMENRETIRKVPAHRSMKIFVTLLVFLMVIFQQKRKIWEEVNYYHRGNCQAATFQPTAIKFQKFRRSQQQHLEHSESRDDTVQSKDSTFFSYTNCSTSNHSSRDFYEYQPRSDEDAYSSSHRTLRSSDAFQVHQQTHQGVSDAPCHSWIVRSRNLRTERGRLATWNSLRNKDMYWGAPEKVQSYAVSWNTIRGYDSIQTCTIWRTEGAK